MNWTPSAAGCLVGKHVHKCLVVCCAVPGTRVYTYLWARGPSNDVVQLQYLLLNSANMVAASYPVDAYVDTSVTLINTYQHFTLVRLPLTARPATGAIQPKQHGAPCHQKPVCFPGGSLPALSD